MLGTKLRALYQRKKGRDLYDLHQAFTSLPNLNTDLIIICFKKYIGDKKILRLDFLKSMEEKLLDQQFQEDIIPLLPKEKRSFDPHSAYEMIRINLIEKI